MSSFDIFMICTIPWLLCWSGYFISYSINFFISFFSNFGLLYQNLEFSMRCFSLPRGQMRFETWPAFIDICHLNIEIQNQQSVELFWVNFTLSFFPRVINTWAAYYELRIKRGDWSCWCSVFAMWLSGKRNTSIFILTFWLTGILVN